MSDSAPRSERPVIGISAYSQQARWGSWDLPAVLLPRRYTDMVAAGGGQPVLLPPQPGVASLLDRLDGLVLSGGGDIDPARYGADRDPATDPANPRRDDAEIELARQAIAAAELAEPASFMIAVQWHPEAGDDLSLFGALAAAAERYRAARQ